MVKKTKKLEAEAKTKTDITDKTHLPPLKDFAQKCKKQQLNSLKPFGLRP